MYYTNLHGTRVNQVMRKMSRLPSAASAPSSPTACKRVSSSRLPAQHTLTRFILSHVNLKSDTTSFSTVQFGDIGLQASLLICEHETAQMCTMLATSHFAWKRKRQSLSPISFRLKLKPYQVTHTHCRYSRLTHSSTSSSACRHTSYLIHLRYLSVFPMLFRPIYLSKPSVYGHKRQTRHAKTTRTF
jgi:hypothetical protein